MDQKQILLDELRAYSQLLANSQPRSLMVNHSGPVGGAQGLIHFYANNTVAEKEMEPGHEAREAGACKLLLFHTCPYVVRYLLPPVRREGQDGRMHYYIRMEACDGHLRPEIKPKIDADDFLKQLIVGLMHLDRSNISIISRDLKVENVLEKYNDERKKLLFLITDFGASRAILDPSNNIFCSNNLEQSWRGPRTFQPMDWHLHMDEAPSTKEDIWSLGILLIWIHLKDFEKDFVSVVARKEKEIKDILEDIFEKEITGVISKVLNSNTVRIPGLKKALPQVLKAMPEAAQKNFGGIIQQMCQINRNNRPRAKEIFTTFVFSRFEPRYIGIFDPNHQRAMKEYTFYRGIESISFDNNVIKPNNIDPKFEFNRMLLVMENMILMYHSTYRLTLHMFQVDVLRQVRNVFEFELPDLLLVDMIMIAFRFYIAAELFLLLNGVLKDDTNLKNLTNWRINRNVTLCYNLLEVWVYELLLTANHEMNHAFTTLLDPSRSGTPKDDSRQLLLGLSNLFRDLNIKPNFIHMGKFLRLRGEFKRIASEAKRFAGKIYKQTGAHIRSASQVKPDFYFIRIFSKLIASDLAVVTSQETYESLFKYLQEVESLNLERLETANLLEILTRTPQNLGDLL